MKLFRYNGHFTLPDDFTGNVSDALRLLADYHESKMGESTKKEKVIKEENDIFNKSNSLLYSHWMEAHEEGKRHVAHVSLIEYKDEDKEWIDIDPYNKEKNGR